MKFTNELLGSNLMYVITSGLYSGSLDCIREYVQNAWDPDANAKTIHIDSENGEMTWQIKDDGAGMDEKELERALGVGLYTKNMEKAEGMFGIGIYSGVAVCNKLVIITKKANMTEKLRIEIDAKKLREGSLQNIPILEFLSSCTTEIQHLKIDKDEENRSFTIIRLESILPRDVFTEDRIIEYVSSRLPVQISKNFKYYEKIERFIDEIIFRPIRIFVNDKEIFRFQNVSNKILEPIVTDMKLNGKTVAKIWYCASETGEAIKGNRGISLKHNGFTIQDWSSLRSLIGGRFNERYIGEIHIVSPNLKPTANRNDLQPTDESLEFNELIHKFFVSLQRINSYQTVNIVSPLKKINKARNSDLSTKLKILEDIERKNFKEDISNLKNDPLVSSLISLLEKKEAESRLEFQNFKKEVDNEKVNQPPARSDYKKMLPEFFINEKLKNIASTLIEKKFIDDMTINPFNYLKEEIENKVDKNKKFSSFSEACDEIGETLTLFRGSNQEKESNKDVVNFFKTSYRLFRNYFEHASKTPSTFWFENAKEKDKLKASILILLALIENMIDLMEIKGTDQS